MKIFILSFFLCLTVATALVPRRTRDREIFSKNDPELLKLARNERVFINDTFPMRSAKLNRSLFNQKPSPRHADIEIKQFETRLDHFSGTDLRTVEFNYFLKDEYFSTFNGSIFIYINDGGVFTTQFLESGLMHDIAIEVHAALVTADLRYFRSNLPTADASFDNLRFLSSEQIVADIASLIEEVRRELNAPDANVILWGTGYGASLATWARREYPDLIEGVWSSSGIFERTLTTSEPYESLDRTIREIGGDECATNVQNAFTEFEYLLRVLDWFYIEDTLDLCIFIWDYYDEEMAIASHGLIEMIQQYFEVYHYHGVLNFCADLQSNTRPEAYAAFARWVRHVFTDRTCLEFDYYSRVNLVGQEDWNYIEYLTWGPVNTLHPLQNRPQMHQRCNELANLPVTVNSGTIFGRLIQQEFWFLYCSDTFYGTGYDYTELRRAAEALNERYGGKNPNITSVIFTNGELDPYFSFGINLYSGDDSHVFNIPHHFKSSDLNSVTPHDSAEVRAVKTEIRAIVTEWARR